jgi:hypothetical protein
MDHGPGCAVGPRWRTLAPQVLAVDADRLWMLMGDRGVPIREVVPSDRHVDLMVELLHDLRGDAAHHRSVDTAVARLGPMPDRRVRLMPELLAALLGGYGTPIASRLRRAVPVFIGVCARLGSMVDARRSRACRSPPLQRSLRQRGRVPRRLARRLHHASVRDVVRDPSRTHSHPRSDGTPTCCPTARAIPLSARNVDDHENA